MKLLETLLSKYGLSIDNLVTEIDNMKCYRDQDYQISVRYNRKPENVAGNWIEVFSVKTGKVLESHFVKTGS